MGIVINQRAQDIQFAELLVQLEIVRQADAIRLPPSVGAVRVVRFSATGSPPWATLLSLLRATLRASSAVNSATDPSVSRLLLPSAFRYWMI